MNEPFGVATRSVLLSCTVSAVGALDGVLCRHPDDVQQTGEQLQGEVEHANPKAYRRERGSFSKQILITNNTPAAQQKCDLL